ncbi:MAG: hypothetical protein M1814_005552 [Vezdaea aestivalis]|nr:MAG: hypothetical protein M1814_005552 [Vezdaea aestivalis]
MNVWARTIAMEQYSLLVELDLHLMSLQYLGKELANFYHPLPQNCILFHLSDGIYTSFTDMPTDSDAVWPRQIKGKAEKVNLTSSFDALMKLANLDDCIQDAAATKERIATQIDSLLTNNRTPQNVIDNSARSNEELGKIGDAVEREQQKLVKAKQKKAESTSSLEARRKALGQGGKGSAGTRALVDDAQVSSKVLQKDLDVVQEDIQGQRRRISEDIIRIYPIEAVQGRPFAFTIRGLYLPNTDFEETDEDHVAGALGYVAEVIFLLACYLYTPLPYPLQLFGSTSTIEDPIAMMTGSRIFPLYPKGSITFRFEYGVFLLDKNLEVLMNQSGLRVLDFRHTLPNLKYLLYVLAAGKGEIPARKAGGVKGLLGMGRSPALSRTNSQDSDVGLWTQRIAGLSLKHKHALNRLREEGSDFISNR